MKSSLTMAEMREQILATGKYSEQVIRHQNRESLEFICGTLGISVRIRKTKRLTYERLLGYDFGGWVFQDILYDGSNKQFYFEKFEHEECTDTMILGYEGFKEYIERFDYPKK